MDEQTARMIQQLKSNPAMLQALMQSRDGQALMQMLSGGDRGASLQRAAQSAAKGNPAEMEKWALVEDLRDDVNVVLENARNEKKIGKALEAHVVLYPQGDEGKRAMEKLSAFTTDQLADLFIVSDVEIAQGAGAAGVKVPGIQAAVSEAKGEKCERCWKHHIKVGADKEHPTLCPRCAKVIRTIEL